MACKTIQHVFIPNLKLFRLIKTELRAKEVGEFSVLWQNGLMGILLSTNNMAQHMPDMGIFFNNVEQL